MVEDISPRDSLDHTLRWWWVIALAMIAGGLIGWGLSRLSAPVYEARAGYRVSVDTQAVLAELQKSNPQADLNSVTYDVLAPYLSPVAEMFLSPAVRSALAEKAQAEGVNFPPDGFRTGQLYLDQHGEVWTLVVRHAQGSAAARLANWWVEIADQELHRARDQAVLALSLKLQSELLSRCFSSGSLAEANLCAGTSFGSPGEMQAQLQDLDSRIQEASSASAGISPLVSFDRGAEASAPAYPLYYRPGLLAVAGSLLGLVLGGILVQRLPLKKA